MDKAKYFSYLLRAWSLYELANALLSSVFLEEGAKLYGITKWLDNPNAQYVFIQYAVTLAALSIFYYIAATDTRRYTSVAWVLVAEQVVGAAFAAVNLSTGLLDPTAAAITFGSQAAMIGLVLFLKPPEGEPVDYTASLTYGGETRAQRLQFVLWFWAAFEFSNALLSSVFLDTGAQLYSASAYLADDRMRYIFYQYAMGMFVLSAGYGLMATDAVRYEALVLVLGIEQLLAVFGSVYLASAKQVTIEQFFTTFLFQLAVIALVISFQPSRRAEPPKPAKTA